MRLILGLAAPTAGHALVNGRRFDELPTPLREVGALLDAAAVHPGRTAGWHLVGLARSNAIPLGRVDEVLDMTALASVGGRRDRIQLAILAYETGLTRIGDPT